MCIHIDIFMHCALYVFYEANKDDYYNYTYTNTPHTPIHIYTNTHTYIIKLNNKYSYVIPNLKTYQFACIRYFKY